MPIGTAASLVLGSTILSTGLGILQGNKAAKAQGRAADEATRLQAEIYEDIKARLAPTETAGNNALAAMMFDMGLRKDKVDLRPDLKLATLTERDKFGVKGKGFDTRAEARKYLLGLKQEGKIPADADLATFINKRNRRFKIEGGGKERFLADEAQANEMLDRRNDRIGDRKFYGGYETSPGYEFRLKQGTDVIEASASARGGLYAGETLKELTEFGQDHATSDYANHLARLFGVAGMGSTAVSGINTAGGNFADAAGNNAIRKGNARADALLNVGNQFNSGLQNGLRAYGAFA